MSKTSSDCPELPGYFRISLTATEEMIDRALPGFGAVMKQAQKLRNERSAVLT